MHLLIYNQVYFSLHEVIALQMLDSYSSWTVKVYALIINPFSLLIVKPTTTEVLLSSS